MPLKLNVGLSKKIGLPQYGSLGATCHVEIELDRSLLDGDHDRFQQFVRQSYAACATAVNDELARQQAGVNVNGSRGRQPGDEMPESLPHPAVAAANPAEGQENRISQKQRNYARQLAGQIQGIGLRRLDQVVERMFVKPLEALTSLEASSLIDTLKAVKAGSIPLEKLLPEAAA